MPTGSPSSTATARRADAHNSRTIRGIRAVLIFVTLLGGSAGAETEQDSSKTRSRVRELIVALESDQRAVRVQSERDLTAIGPAALQYLPAPDVLPSVSVRQAVRRVRVVLEHRAARESVKASRVTLRGEFPLSELIAELSRQTGNAISTAALTSPDIDRSVAVKWNDTSFWAAIATLEAAGFGSRFTGEGQFELHRISRSPIEQRVVIDEAFRTRADRVTARKIDENGSSVLLKAPLTIECEPRLRPLFLRMSTNDFQMRLADGSQLGPFNSDGRIEVPLGDGGRAANIDLAFVSDEPVRNDVSLQGGVSILTAGLEQPIRFRNLASAPGTARRRGGVTVTLQKLAQISNATDGRFMRVEIRVSYDAGANAFESHQTWVFLNRVFLQDEKGQQVSPSAFETLYQGDGTIGVAYRFDNSPEELKGMQFVYMAPTLLINVPLTLAIEDVPVVQP